MIEDQIILYRVHTHVHAASPLEYLLFQLCFIKEESEFGDKVYSSGCMPFQVFKFFFRYNFALFLKLKTVFHFKQQCISIVSNTHAVTDLSNMHHYTYSTTTKLMTSASSTKLLTSAHTNLPTSASPTKSQTPTPGHTTNIPTSVHSTALPTSVSTLSTTAALMGIPVVGRRQERQKRYTSCEHCCRGDLCNNACVHHSEFLFVTSILQKTLEILICIFYIIWKCVRFQHTRTILLINFIYRQNHTNSPLLYGLAAAPMTRNKVVFRNVLW